MNPTTNPTNEQRMQQLQQLPNSTAALVLGIVSIALCWCYGIISIVTGIIGIIMGSKAVALYQQSPGVYSEASYKNANAGKICAIIGLVLSALYIILILALWSTYFTWLTSFMENSTGLLDSAINR